MHTEPGGGTTVHVELRPRMIRVLLADDHGLVRAPRELLVAAPDQGHRAHAGNLREGGQEPSEPVFQATGVTDRTTWEAP